MPSALLPSTPSDKAVRPSSPISRHLHVTPRWLVTVTQRLQDAAASRLLVYVGFTMIYLIPTLWICRIKLFWDDEFFTLYLARAPWHSLVQALFTGADQHPPAFYYLTHLVTQLFGTSHLTVRLPAIFGFWLFCICAYEIVRSLAAPSWAVVAMLLPLATDFYYYATEARGYGLVTGFAALAVLSWLKVTAHRRRTLFLPLLAFGLVAAISSHYYAVLTAFSLGIGELVRTRQTRRFDLGVWVALAFTFVPIVLFLPVIRGAKQYSLHFWAIPAWSDALKFYPSELGLGIFPLLGALAFAVSFGFSLSGWIEIDPLRQRGPLKSWEATALCLLAALPFLTMALAKLVTHGFSNRYAIATAAGVTILTAYTLSRIAPRSLAALAAALTCLCVFLIQVRLLRSRFLEERVVYKSYVSRLSQTGTQQIAISEWGVMHRVSFYSPRSLATRVVYVAAPDISIKELGQDTIDRGALALRPWFPLQILSVPSFLNNNQHFLVFGHNVEHWTWIIHELPQWGNTTLLNASSWDGRFLFYVDQVRVIPNPHLVPQQRDAETQMLFSQMPRTGPSLCSRWMRPDDCP